MGRPANTNGSKTVVQIVRLEDANMAHEVRYIQKRASQRDARIVSIFGLLLFSTETGDAWLLDREDQLAARVARDGVAERIHIRENRSKFEIGWKGDYRFDGTDFVYSDWETGRTVVISGYPVAQLRAASHLPEAR